MRKPIFYRYGDVVMYLEEHGVSRWRARTLIEVGAIKRVYLPGAKLAIYSREQIDRDIIARLAV